MRLVQLKQTASPPGIPDPGLNKTPSTSSLQSFMNDLRNQEVPYSQAPPLKGSNFEALKNLNLLDAKTHKFAQAWRRPATPVRARSARSSTAGPTGAIPT